MKPQPTPQNPDPEQTRILAHRYWEQAGCPTGLDLQFWLAAEQELLAQQGRTQLPVPSASAKRRSPGSRGNAKAR